MALCAYRLLDEDTPYFWSVWPPVLQSVKQIAHGDASTCDIVSQLLRPKASSLPYPCMLTSPTGCQVRLVADVHTWRQGIPPASSDNAVPYGTWLLHRTPCGIARVLEVGSMGGSGCSGPLGWTVGCRPALGQAAAHRQVGHVLSREVVIKRVALHFRSFGPLGRLGLVSDLTAGSSKVV